MNPETDFIIYFAAWTLCGILGAAIGSTAKRAGLGFALGILLGPLGLLLTAILVIGQRPAQQPSIIYMPGPQTTAASPSPPLTQQNPLANLPDHLTIARDGQILGTWPLADVIDYLSTGHLSPNDTYQNGHHWVRLARLTA